MILLIFLFNKLTFDFIKTSRCQMICSLRKNNWQGPQWKTCLANWMLSGGICLNEMSKPTLIRMPGRRIQLRNKGIKIWWQSDNKNGSPRGSYSWIVFESIRQQRTAKGDALNQGNCSNCGLHHTILLVYLFTYSFILFIIIITLDYVTCIYLYFVKTKQTPWSERTTPKVPPFVGEISTNTEDFLNRSRYLLCVQCIA
jgi:hypothetical protein